METRLTLRPRMPGTKKLAARCGEWLVCVRYLYDQTRGRRLKTVEPVIEEAPWHGRARKPRRQNHDRDGVIRIFGAGYWRKGKQVYERENQVHKRAPRKD